MKDDNGTNSALESFGRDDALNLFNTSIIDINEVDIIMYDFTLAKVGCLKTTTIYIIKELLASLEDSLDWRWRRFTAHNLEIPFGEENDLIGTLEDGEESLLYFIYSSDSHEKNDDNYANNSQMYLLCTYM